MRSTNRKKKFAITELLSITGKKQHTDNHQIILDEFSDLIYLLRNTASDNYIKIDLDAYPHLLSELHMN